MVMWKKLLVALVTLIGAFSVGYAYYNHEMKAAGSTTYNIGGNVTGRVNMAPVGISGTHIGLQAGDHVMIGGSNPHTGNPLSFQLLVFDENYTDYDNTDTVNVIRNPISSWLSVSDELVSKGIEIEIGNPSIYDYFTGNTIDYCFGDYSNTMYYEKEYDFKIGRAHV